MGKDELMTPKEVGTLLRVSRETVRRWGMSGVLTPVKLTAQSFRYRRSEVEALIQKEAS